jgi:CRP/FNR family transcriptional regulator, cyclic AMP receptor protein
MPPPASPMLTPAELLGSTPQFGSLALADRQQVAARMRPATFSNGQLIFSRGDMTRDIYLVLEGRVRLSILSGEGRELSLTHATPGTLFGEIACLDGGPRTANATAIAVVKVLLLPHASMATLMDTNPRIATAMVRFLCTRLRQTDDKLESIALHPIEVRLARFLMSAILLQSPGASGKQVPLDLKMNQSEVGLLIGASRPKVNSALMALEDTGAVTRAGTKLVCDMEALADYCTVE